MTRLKNCPFCGGEARILEIEGRNSVCCSKCGIGTIATFDTDKNIAAWNRRPPARKLTLDELREMDGQPVWIDNGFAEDVICGLVALLWVDITTPKELQKEQEVIVFRYGDYLPLKDVNVHYKAYDRPPGGDGQ